MTELTPEDQIIAFCRGYDVNRAKCDLYYLDSQYNPSCKDNPARQWCRALMQWCDRAVKNGVPGRMHDLGFVLK